VHRRQALELATTAGSKDQVAKCMMQLAAVQRQRGRLNEAMQMCEQAKELSIAERRAVYAVQQECLRDWGRFEEALEVLNLARGAQKFPTPSAQRRMDAAFSASEAILQAELGHPEAALSLFDNALEGVQNDPKLSLQFRASRVWALGMLGHREEVATQTEAIEAELPKYAKARGTQTDCLSSLGRAFFILEDYRRSQGFWERYLAEQPDPIYLPKVYYFLGECLLRTGDAAGAVNRFRQAVETGQDTYYVRCARRRLAEGNEPAAK
jgi:tetratricopeptide (TPR) repeat protein